MSGRNKRCFIRLWFVTSLGGDLDGNRAISNREMMAVSISGDEKREIKKVVGDDAALKYEKATTGPAAAVGRAGME